MLILRFTLTFLQSYVMLCGVIIMSDTFSRFVYGDKMNFKYAKGVSDHSGKEFHLFHELVLFFGGDVELISETSHTRLKPNDLIVIPKETYHQVVISNNQDDYHRCVFQFEETDENRELINKSVLGLNVIESDQYVSYLFEKMIKLAQSEDQTLRESISQSVLTLLLDEIRAKNITESQINQYEPLTNKAIEYINDRLTENLSTDTISLALNVSPSTLMHTFKKNMNIPIRKYIIKKRLILAHTRIANGEPATSVAVECGFNDYSGFYKQYKKMFETTPSKNTRI